MSDYARILDDTQTIQLAEGLGDVLVAITAGPIEAAAVLTMVLGRIGDKMKVQGEPYAEIAEVVSFVVEKLELLIDAIDELDQPAPKVNPITFEDFARIFG